MRRLARIILKAFGWSTVGEIPPFDKAVFIVAPHTSNWDGFWLLIYKVALGVELRFFAKGTLFWWPLGSILTAMGALPVERDTTASYVQQLVDAFAGNDHLILALAPEGTRKWQPYWRTGFYEIAVAAEVPIVLAFIDYRKKQMGVGITLPATRELEQDLKAMQDFYGPIEGRRPKNQGPIEFPADHRSSPTTT